MENSTNLYNLEHRVGELLYPGRTAQDRELNKVLLKDYDYEKYVEGLTGYAGQDLQNIAVVRRYGAKRTRIGSRGHYKAGLAFGSGIVYAAPCVALRGKGPYDVSFKIQVYASRDMGLSWEKINKTELDGKEPSLLYLDDGTLLLTAQPIMEGKMGYQLPVYRSADGGVTWSKETLDGNRDYPRNLFLDKDKSIVFMRCSAVRFEFEEELAEKGNPTLEINRSIDGGRTWSRCTGVIKDWDYPGFMEVASLRLPSGRLVAALRHQPSGTKGEGFENTLLTWSSDNGTTWTRPVQVSGTGEVHFHMTLLEDGRLLATYSHYHLPYGVCAMLSADEGETWDRDNIFQLALSADYYTGWGATCQLPDGGLITSYASTPYLCEPPDTTVCEAVSWRIPGL